MAKVEQLIPSQDGMIRAAKVLLPNKKCLNRPINLLCPMECPVEDGSDDGETIPKVVDDGIGDTEVEPRSKRQAAVNARKKMKQWLPFV